MLRLSKIFPSLAAAMLVATPLPAMAQSAGDLLVAPTRVVLDGSRGTEVILNNIGTATATYRISLETKRMTPLGGLDEISEQDVNAVERAALDMISINPRRVVLQPNQPQVIRVGVRVPDGTPSGEYRAHLLFRAVPDVVPAVPDPSKADATSVSIALTPIYGITIPVIVRIGDLDAQVSIGDARIETTNDGPAFSFDLTRTGNRSVYGDIIVTRPGVTDPLLVARGIAVYPELNARKVLLNIPSQLADALKGPVHIRYAEDREMGGGTIDEADRVVN